MKQFQAGFSRVDVTPSMGVEINGYYVDRFAEGVLDSLQANAIALALDDVKILLISLDNLHLPTEDADVYRAMISEATGVAREAIFIACTHSHTTPKVGAAKQNPGQRGDALYEKFLGQRLCDSAVFALADLKPAKIGHAVGQAPNIAFIRRFRMKNGGIQTNPGVNNPDIVAPIGNVDERVNVVRIVREGGHEIILANFGDHPDTVGGSMISADYPHFVRKYTEAAIENVRCVFFNGAQGDVNHVNVHPVGGDANGLHPMFDGADRGYEHTAHMGRVVAGAIMQVYAKVKFFDVDEIGFLEKTIFAPANLATPEQLAIAEKYAALHNAGRDAEIPYESMELTTVVAESLRMVRMKDGPDAFPMKLIGVRIGEIAFLGIPGEPFTGIGLGIKEGSPYAMTLPCCLTNGSEGYFPMKEAYDEGGYEARSSSFKAGIAELIIDESVKILKELKN